VKKTIFYMILAVTPCLSASLLEGQVPRLNSFPAARATIYLDFYGHSVAGTVWNSPGVIDADPPGLVPEAVSEIFRRVAASFSPFNLNITTDSAVFERAPLFQRLRLIFTPSGEWYGKVAGAAAIGSFSWGDATPAWVFTGSLGNDPRMIAATAAHEIGHALGLLHQSVYDEDCNKISEYNGGEGKGDAGWAPIMGVSYYKAEETWIRGPSSLGCASIQDDREVIAGSPNNFGYRLQAEDPQASIQFTVTRDQGLDHLGWSIRSADSPANIRVEGQIAQNGFRTLATLSGAARNFTWQPPLSEDMTYQIRVESANGPVIYYSDRIRIQIPISEKKLRWFVATGQLTVISKANYNFQLFDASGRIWERGILHAGSNLLSFSATFRGLIFLRWQDGEDQHVEKLMVP
jgi:hypothetical protein